LIAEPETHFLDPADDLVSICSDTLPRPPFQLSSEDRSYDPSSSMLSSDNENPHHTHSSHSSHSLPPQHHENAEKSPLAALAAAIAAMILIPILTFNVIPNFIGRITVTFLVACFAIFGLVLSGVQKHELFGREGMLCAGVYGGVMIVVAGLMG
jgi:hypothetical protein